MICAFPSRTRCVALSLLFLIVSVEKGLAKTGQSTARQTAATSGSDQSLAANILAAQVSEIAGSKMISRAKKEKRISTTVRVAVVAATAYNSNPRQTLNLALELTAAAAAAAPSFAEEITNAVSFAPALAQIDGAKSQIRTAAFAAAKSPKTRRAARVAATRNVESNPTAEEFRPEPATETSLAETGATESEPAPQTRSHRASVPPESADEGEEPTSRSNKFTADRNSNFVVTAAVSARHDDNLFLSNPNVPVGPTNPPKVGDTIYALSPGVEFQYGQNSLSHGTVKLSEAFTRYADKTAPNANLFSGAGDIGYNNGDLSWSSDAKFNQLYQNTRDTAAASGQSVIRQDVLGFSTNIEAHFTPKTSLGSGVIFNKTSYKSTGLADNQDVNVPLKVYYAITPKVSLSSGVEYRRSKTSVANSDGKELYYNLGARGEFTPKLSGEFSVGYRSRSVDNVVGRENILSFNGNFAYEVTAKTNASLNFSRGFSTDALGKSLKNSSYGLRLSTTPSPQWQFSSGLNYQALDYGLITLTPPTPATNRNDGYWVVDFQATYLFTNSLSAAFDYSFRKNHSTIPTLPGATFTDNLFSLMFNWKY